MGQIAAPIGTTKADVAPHPKPTKSKPNVQVSQHFLGGGVRDVVQNLTLDLDLEIVISILKDVVSAMDYLHQLGPCIAHQPLSSSKVLYLPCNGDVVYAALPEHNMLSCIAFCHGAVHNVMSCMH